MTTRPRFDLSALASDEDALTAVASDPVPLGTPETREVQQPPTLPVEDASKPAPEMPRERAAETPGSLPTSPARVLADRRSVELNVRIPADLRRRVKVAAAVHGASMQALVEVALEEYLGGLAGRNP